MAQNSKLKTQYLALALLLVFYLVVAFTHAYLAPLTIGPDELAHYEYMHFIADHGRLPLDKDERDQASYKSDQPPLYHLLAALPASLVDPSGPPYLKRVQDHKRRQLIERTRHAWGLYNTEDERWPYQGEVLRWQVGRWVGILFGAATVFVTFFVAREVFAWIEVEAEDEAKVKEGKQAWVVTLGAAAIVAFIPRFTLTGSMLNYETTLAFFAALFLWVLLRMANPKSTRNQPKTKPKPETRNTKHALLLGLFAGLAITAKLSALILPVEIVMALWLIGRTYDWNWKIWLRHILIAAVATLVAVSWWFGFVIYQFNTVAEDGLWIGLLKPLIAADSSDATTNRLLSFLTSGQAGFTGAIDNLDSGPPWEWLAIFFRTFWVAGIEQQQPLGLWGLVVVLGLVLLAAYGLVVVWRTIRHSPSLRLVLFLLLLHLCAAFILPLARYAVTFSLADTAQGRHILFQTAPAFAILLVWGIVSIINYQLPITNYQFLRIKNFASPFAVLTPGLFLLFWSGVQLWTMTWAYIPLLPVQTRPIAQAQVTHPIDQPLNEFVTLLGYNSHLDDENQILRVDLLWQATAISPVDYLTEVKLVDKQGAVQAEWLGYSVSGRYPTRAWDVGDIVRDTVWLPIGGLEAGQYDLILNLRAMKLKRHPPETSLSLGPVAISDSTPRIFNSSLPFTGAVQAAAGYSIWQDGKPFTTPKVFRYRETVLITFSSLLPGQQRNVWMIGPNAADLSQERSFAPVYESDMMALFIVGPDWPTGDYHLQVTLTTSAEGSEQSVNTGPLLHVIDRWERKFNDSFDYQRVEANFADQVKLLGYDLSANRAEAGGGIPVMLYWQGLDWMGDDYTIFVKLLAADQTVHGGRDRLPQEGYSTLYWGPGEIIPDSFGVPVDDDAPDGIYYVNVGLYKEVNQQALSLPLVQDGQPLEATSINIGPIKIGNTPPGFTIEAANPRVELNQPFGVPNLTLIGYDLTNETGQPIQNQKSKIQNLKLTLYWRSETILPVDYTTFVHIRNEAGEIVAQKDQLPLNGAYPTSLWDTGEIIADEINVPLPAELPGGDYQIVIGLYDFLTGQRLIVPDNPANEVKLTGVKTP